MSKKRGTGRWIACSRCGGSSLIQTIGGVSDCTECEAGNVWLYPSGSVARFPGGPLLGKLSSAEAEIELSANEASR